MRSKGILLRAALAPLTVLVLHAVLSAALNVHNDSVAHLLGGAAMAYFLNQLLITQPQWFGRPGTLGRAVIAFCMTATVALFWEFMEFLTGGSLGYVQFSLPETMGDLLIGCAGAFLSLSIATAWSWRRASMSLPRGKLGLLVLSVAGTLGCPAAHAAPVPIWPSSVPAGRAGAAPESTGSGRSPVAGRPWHYVTRVSRPTITVHAPKGKNTGTAVIVFPGGGYEILAMDLEGTEVCDWLTSKGITCVLLKYRVPNKGPTWNRPCGCNLETGSSMPLEDAQRAIGLVRSRAKEWHIDPHKIGVLGFSAGGHLVAAISTNFTKRMYPPVDAIDQESCRPDFAVAIYPGHLFDYEKSQLFSDIHITADTPPTFLLHAENDPVDGVSHSLVYYDELKNAKVPVELHLYAEGGHAFGLRETKLPITRWPRLVETWLRTIGMISN